MELANAAPKILRPVNEKGMEEFHIIVLRMSWDTGETGVENQRLLI